MDQNVLITYHISLHKRQKTDLVIDLFTGPYISGTVAPMYKVENLHQGDPCGPNVQKERMLDAPNGKQATEESLQAFQPNTEENIFQEKVQSSPAVVTFCH